MKFCSTSFILQASLPIITCSAQYYMACLSYTFHHMKIPKTGSICWTIFLIKHKVSFMIIVYFVIKRGEHLFVYFNFLIPFFSITFLRLRLQIIFNTMSPAWHNILMLYKSVNIIGKDHNHKNDVYTIFGQWICDNFWKYVLYCFSYYG